MKPNGFLIVVKDTGKAAKYYHDLFGLETLYPETEFVNPPMTHSWGRRVVRFYDPDGNLVEVGTPM